MTSAKRPAVALQHRCLAGEVLPAGDGDIDIGRIELDGMAAAAGHLGGNDRGAGSAERLIDGLAGRGVVLDRPPHAFDRLLGAVAGRRLPVRDGPDGGLLAIARPVARLALPDGIPGRLVLPVIVAAADDQPGLVPDDLRADGKAAGLEAGGDRGGVQGAMPDIDTSPGNSAQASRQSARSSFSTLPLARPRRRRTAPAMTGS